MEHGIPPACWDRACDLVMLCRFESYRPHHFKLGTERHCMKKIGLALMFVSTVAFGQNIGVIDARKNVTKQTTITWQYSDNVVEACNAERKRYGLPTYKQPSMACSFWTENTCLIITSTKTDADTLAHEVLHCYQGKWH